MDLKKIGKKFKERSPEIMTGLGIGGMLTATVLAVKATPKAISLLEDAREEKSDDLTATEIVKVAWKPYLPAVGTAIVSAAMIIGAKKAYSVQHTALAAACSLSETALKEYRAKVEETLGEKKAREIDDAIAKAQLENKPLVREQVIITDKGKTLCFDAMSGRYFYSDIDKLRKAENMLNRQMREELTITVNDFYAEIGLPCIDSNVGDNLGWEIDRGYIELRFSAQLSEDDTPCLVVTHGVSPIYLR